MDMFIIKSAILDLCYIVSNKVSTITKDAKDYVASPIFCRIV